MVLKIGSLLLLVLWIFLGIGCSIPSEPKAPSWDTQFVIPLADYTVRFEKLSEEIGEDSVLVVDDRSVFHITYRGTIERFEVGDQLKVDPPEPTHVSEAIGDIALESPGAQRTSLISFDTETEGAYASSHGTVVDSIEGFQIPAIVRELPLFEEFQWAKIKEGYVDVTVVNEMMIYLGSPLMVTVQSRAGVSFERQIVFDDPIPPGGSATKPFSLEGQTIPNALQVTVEGYSIGSAGEQVMVDMYSGFFVEVWISPLVVSGAKAKIPEQRFSVEDASALDEKTQVVEGRIKSGNMTLDIENRLPVDAVVTVNVPALTKGGTPLRWEFEFEASHGTEPVRDVISEDLTGYVLANPTGEVPLDSLRYLVDVVTVDTKDEYAKITSEDFVEAAVSLDMLRFSYLKGNWVEEQRFEVPRTKSGTSLEDLPKGSEPNWIAFREALFTMEVVRGEMDAPITFYVTMIGERFDDEGVLEERVTIAEEARIERDQSSFTIDVAELISMLPDSIEVSGTAGIAGEIEITDRSYVEAEVDVDAPMTFRIQGTSMEVGEVEALEIGERVREAFEREDVKEVRIVGEIENHNPLSGLTRLLVSPDAASFGLHPTGWALAKIDTLLRLDLPQPAFGSDGSIKAPGTAPISVVLVSTDFDVFEHPVVYAKTEVALDSTRTSENPLGWVSLKETDYVRIKARAEMALKVDPDRW